MKFVCPVCKTAGDIPDREKGPDQVDSQTICQAGQEPQQNLAASHSRSKNGESSVLSMRPQDKGKKDYLAVSIFVAVLCVLIAIGVYFSLNITPSAWNRPLQTISELLDDAARYGKTILE